MLLLKNQVFLLLAMLVVLVTTTVHAGKTKGVRHNNYSRRRHLEDSTTGNSNDDNDDNNGNNNIVSGSADIHSANDSGSNDNSLASDNSIDESDGSDDSGDSEEEESSSSDSKKSKSKAKQRSLPPLDANGKRIPKDYQFKPKPDGLQIQTRYRDDVIASLDKGKKGKRYTEKMDWNIQSNEEGFSVETWYENRNELTDVKTSIKSSTFKIVEFVKNDPEDINEVYIDQLVVTEHFFNEWQPPQFEGKCTATTTCRGIFSTVDECFTVIATANIHTAIANGRFQMDPDDVKFDYVFGDSCSLSSDNHGLSVVGKVRTDTKTNVKSHNKGLLPMDTDMEGMEEQQVASDLDGVASEEDDGVSLFLTWINELDCTEVTMDDTESSSSGVEDFIPVDVNNALMNGNLDHDGANVSSIIAQQITNQTRVVPRGANVSDVGHSEGIIHTTQRTLPINVHTYDVDTSSTTEDGDSSSSSSSSSSSEKYIHWTFGTSRKDRGCVWDPVVGVEVTEEVTMSSAASTGVLISALSATGIVVLAFAGVF